MMVKPEKCLKSYKLCLKQVTEDLSKPSMQAKLLTRAKLLADPTIRHPIPSSQEQRFIGYTNSSYFELVETVAPNNRPLAACYRLKEGLDATSALTDLLTNRHTIMVLTAQGKLNLVQHIALLKFLTDFKGDDEGSRLFNQLFAHGPVRLCISPFSALEGTVQHCCAQSVLDAPFSPLNLFFKETTLPQHPDNERVSYHLTKGDIVYFENHPSYLERHPLGENQKYIGVCVQAGFTDENSRFILPAIGEQPLSALDVRDLCLNDFKQTPPPWYRQDWAKMYVPPTFFMPCVEHIEDTDLSNFIATRTVSLDTKLLLEILHEEISIESVHNLMSLFDKLIYDKRQRIVQASSLHALSIYKYVKKQLPTLQAFATHPSYAKHTLRDYTGAMLQAMKPILDYRSNFNLSPNEFVHAAPIQKLVGAFSDVHNTHGLTLMANGEYKYAIELFINLVNYVTILIDYDHQEKKSNAQHYHLLVADADRNIARCYEALNKPLDEIQHCQFCLANRSRWLAEDHDSTIEVKSRLTALKPIREIHGTEIMATFYKLVHRDRNTLLEKGMGYLRTNGHSSMVLGDAINLLDRASSQCASAEASILLANLNLDSVKMLTNMQAANPTKDYVANTHRQMNSPAVKQWLASGVVPQTVVDEIRDNPDPTYHMHSAAKECMKYLARSFCYSTTEDKELRRARRNMFTALINTLGDDTFFEVVNDIAGYHCRTIQCIAWCYLARHYARQETIDGKSQAIMIINLLWDYLGEGLSYEINNPTWSQQLHDWAFKLAAGCLRDIQKHSPGYSYAIDLNTNLSTLLDERATEFGLEGCLRRAVQFGAVESNPRIIS